MAGPGPGSVVLWNCEVVTGPSRCRNGPHPTRHGLTTLNSLSDYIRAHGHESEYNSLASVLQPTDLGKKPQALVLYYMITSKVEFNSSDHATFAIYSTPAQLTVKLGTWPAVMPWQCRLILMWYSPGGGLAHAPAHQARKYENLLLVKMKEKKLLGIQPLPKVLRVHAMRSKHYSHSGNYWRAGRTVNPFITAGFFFSLESCTKTLR